jgi:microcystin-dependent protein
VNRWTVVALSFVAVGVLAYGMGRARAYGIPQTAAMNYSGTLLAFGQPETSSHVMTLNLWGASGVVCTTAAGPTAVTNGRFTVPLDDSCVTAVHQNPGVKVEVVVDGVSMGQSPLGAVPYAVEADTASHPAPGSELGMLSPPGSIMAFAGVVGGAGNVAAPTGWLLCDGQAVSRTQYARLFASIGVNHGAGDGSTTFNVPDYQGYFLRGVDNTANRDPDSASRGAMASGGNAGNAVGSVEGSIFGSHSHGVTDPGHSHGGSTSGVNNAGGATNGFRDWGSNGGGYKGFSYSLHTSASGDFNGHTHAIYTDTTHISINNNGGSETRPLNAYVNYLIKY